MGKKVGKFVGKLGHEGYHFMCPGCKEIHGIYTKGEGVPNWTFNGNEELPTFRASVLVKIPNSDHRCHSFITDGKIRFLADSTHELAGKEVELPDWE